MSATNPQQMLAMLNALVQPWHAALADPEQAQRNVLTRLLQIYTQTDYGKQRSRKIKTGAVGALYLLNFSRGSCDEDLIGGRLLMQVCRRHRTIIRLPEGPSI